MTRRRLTTLEVEELAQLTVAAGGYDAAPAMLVAMAWIESGFDPLAIGGDGKSYGLMQIRPSTAADIVERLGGRNYRSPEDLLNPGLSLDLAARYVDWLATWSGQRRDEAWIVQAYNGGPGTARAGGNADTRRHLCRYQHTKRAYLTGQALPDVARLPC